VACSWTLRADLDLAGDSLVVTRLDDAETIRTEAVHGYLAGRRVDRQERRRPARLTGNVGRHEAWLGDTRAAT